MNSGIKNLLVDHLVDADLLSGRSDVDSFHHPVNSHADNEEMVKAALMMGFGDRILRVRRGRIAKGIIKARDLVILCEYDSSLDQVKVAITVSVILSIFPESMDQFI